MQILTEQIPRKSVIAIANGTKSKHANARSAEQRSQSFLLLLNPGITPGIKLQPQRRPSNRDSKRDILGVCVGIGWGQGPEYNRRILSTYVSAANASFLLILDPGIKTLVSSGRRIESGQSGGGMHGRRVGPNVTGGSYRPEHAAPMTPLPSSSSMRVSNRVPELQLQCRPCVTIWAGGTPGHPSGAGL